MATIREYLKKQGYDFSKPNKEQEFLAKQKYGNLDKEIVSLNDTLTDLFTSGEWRDAPTMNGYSDSLSSTLGKVKGYKDYITKYHANDKGAAELLKVLSDTENYYTGATDNLNYLTGYYGSHTNAKAFADQKAKDDAKAAELLKFQELAKNADFAEKSVYKKPHDDIRYYIDTEDPYEAEFYNINEGDLYRPGIGVDYNIEIDTISDDEKALYNYIAQTQGYEEAYNYLKLNADTLNYRKGKEIANSWAGRNLPILTSLISGVDSAQQGFTNAVNSIVNPNKERPTSAMQYAGGLVGQREMEEGVVQGLAAQISQSIGQMTPQILVSLATGNVGGAAKGVASAASKILSMATLGASVYGNAYNEALQRGQDGWRAYGYGLGNAAVEIAAESFADGINLISSGSWGKALATKLTGNKFKAVTEIVAEIADKPRIKYLLDALGEGAEEVFSTALEPALESFFLKETFDPASVEEMLYSGLLGALTSGVMNAAGLPGQVANYKYYSGMNQTLNDADIDTIRAEAMQMGKKSKSYNAAKEFEGVETKDLANRHRRRILEAFNTENREKTNEIVGTAVARNYAESEKVNDNVDKAAEKAAEMKGKYNTATDGKAYTKDDTEADFSDFTETVEIDEEGNAVFTAKDGRTLSTADDVVPEIVAEGVAMLANLPSIPKSAYSTYFQYLPKQTNTKAYTAAFETLFEMGKNAEGMKLATSAAFADAELDELSQGAIYLQGVNTRKSADEAFKDAVTKARSAAEKNGKFNAKKGKLNDEAVRNMKLTRAQKNAITMLSSFTEFGINVEIYASTEANRKNTPNGWFDSTTGTIHLDINAGENADVVGSGVFWTIAHESTHMIKVTAPEAYKVLQEYVLDEMFETEDALNKAIGEEMMRHDLQHPNEPKMTRAEAIEEIVARSCESIFADSDQLTKMLIEGEARKEGFVDKVINTIQKVIEKITAFFQTLSSEYNPESKEGKFFSETAERMLKLKEIYDNAFAEAVEGAKVVYGTELTPGEEGVVVDADGNPVAYATKTGSVMLSMRTYREEGKDAFRKYLEKCVKNKSLTQEEMTEMLDGIEEIYKICSEFKDKYAPFSKWSDAEVIRDTKGKPVFSVVTPNGEYKMNLDFSLVCKKRRTLDAVFNEMARRGTIDNFELGQKSIVKINEIIRKYGFETACALCFVDAKRFRQASMADAFVNLYNELVRSLVSEENQEDIGFYNFSGNITVKNVESKIDRWESSKLDFSHINHVMKTYDEGTVEYKAAKYIKNNAHARKLLLRGDFMSSAGFDSVKKGDPQILKLYNSKKGTGGPKAAFGDVQYFNEIIKKAKSWTPSKAYSVGGIRVQSFSDYVPRMVFDYVQMIYDLAATKLPAHAYSKEALFVKQFGLTGIKINMSLIPAVAKDGIAPGLDKNGNYVWAGESFDFETARKIQSADGYTENCGTIAVGVSYAHIMKLLSDPDIRMVIPYHKSGLNPIVAHMNRISAFTDYTSRKTNPGGGQHTTDSEGKNVKEEFDFNKTLRELNDPKAAAQAYLDWCKERDYSPKFAEFSQHANYYKLLIDFTVYDKSGNYVPQRAVKAVFPKGEDAFGSMKELIEEGLEEDAIIEGKRDARLGDIVDEIERTIPKTEAEIAEEEVPQAETDVEARIMRSDRSRNNDRDILANVLADSSLKQRYFSQRVFLQKYQDAQTSYNKALEEIEKYSAEEEELHSKIEKIIQNVPPEKLRGIHSRLFRIGEGNFRVNEKYLNGVAKRLISATDTRYSITEVAEMLNDVYAKWSTSSVDNKMIQRDAQALYKKLLGNVRYTGSESNEAFEGAYRDITRVKIALSETQKAELEYAFGKKWRRELFGKFKFSDDGVSLDSRWQEWADMYPHIFDSDTTSAEMATKLVEIRDMVKPGSYAVTEINPAEVSSFARDLYRNYIMAPGVMDFLQKNAEFKHLPGMYNRLREVQGIINRQYERLEAAEEKMFTYEAEGLRDVIDSEINRLNEVARKTGVESRREAIRERVERASRAAEISTISNYVKKTLKLFEGDTKKQYVPEVLKAPIVEFLTFFDFTKAKTNGGVTQQSARLDDAVQALLSVDTEDFDKVIADFEQAVKDNSFGEDTFAFDINEDVVNELKVKFESIKAEIKRFENLEPTQRNIYNMDAEALADLKDALRTIYTIVKQANTLIASGMSIADAANGTIDHIKGTKADVSRAGTAARKAYFSLVDPIRFFSRLGSEAAEIFRQLRIADSRRAFMIKRVQDFLQTSVGAEKIKAWKKETHKIDGIPVLDSEGNVIPGDGETIEVTTPQLMALYAHWRRDQSRKHLADSDDDGNERKSGGGVFRTKHKSGEDTFSERIRFSQEIFDKMTSVLTDEQKDVVVKLQDYMSNEISELGNMVTMKRFGLNAFTEKNYIPIVTRVGDVINEEGGGGSNLLKIIGKSWTKKTNDNASNTIIIDDFFDVFSKHVAEMIDYNAFAIPLLDAVRWLNFKETANGADKSVRAALKNSFGNDGVEFIKTLIEDINGSSAKPSGGIGMQKVVLRNVKTALVGGKLKQIFLQPTAIVRASEILGGKNITKAIGIIGKTKGAEDNVNKTFELATKWSGVALWKSMGYIGVNMSGRTFAETILYGDSGGFWDTIKDTGKALKNKEFEEAYENAIDLGLKPMEIGDKYGWAMLWKASEYKVSETQKNLVPKSDEYYKAVAEVFEEAVYKTQVSDSVLSKPSVLRSKNSLTTISASFMSEPIKSLEWVLDSYAKFVEDTKTMGAKAAFAKNKGNMIRAMWGLTASSIITAIVTSAADTFGDDEESWLDYKIFLKKFFGKHFFDGNLWDELDPLRKIPYVNEIVSIFQKYDPSRLDLESFNEIEQAITALINYFSGKGNYTGIGVVVQTLEALALTTGLPIQNVVKDIKDVWNATVGEAFEDYEIKEKKK